MKCKARIISFLFIAFIVRFGYGQDAASTGNVLNQQNSKIRMMLQQVLLLQTHYQAIKKGYNIISNGLNTAKQWKNGTFNLHQNYYNSLYDVNPAVAGDTKIQAIYDLQQQMSATFDAAIQWQRQSGQLKSDEISYMTLISQNVQKEILASRKELQLVTTPGKAQMTDAERINKIDGIFADVQKQNAFTSAFINQAYVLANLRASGNAGDQSLNKMYQ